MYAIETTINIFKIPPYNSMAQHNLFSRKYHPKYLKSDGLLHGEVKVYLVYTNGQIVNTFSLT